MDILSQLIIFRKTHMKRMGLIWCLVVISSASYWEAHKASFLQQNPTEDGDFDQTLYIVGDRDEGNTEVFSYSDLQSLQAQEAPSSSSFVLQDSTDQTSVPFSFSTVQAYLAQASSTGPQ